MDAELPSVTLKKKRERPIRCGHPWIFSGAIAGTTGARDTTGLVRVLAHDGSLLGIGLRSPESSIRVRMLGVSTQQRPRILDVAFFERALHAALAQRITLGLPESTNAYRVVNSEGDGLPGLTIDRLGDLVVFQLTTMPMFAVREAISQALKKVFPGAAILEIPAPDKIAELEGFAPQHHWWTASPPEAITVHEGDVLFDIPTDDFQKTGHYADMRPHRAWIGGVANGKRVLDAYSYTGGFGLHAARGGAAKVVSVDSSQTACDAARRNATRNDVGEVMEVVHSKIDDYLRSAYDRGIRFDIIVLDPPKLAPNRRAVNKALGVYEAIGVQALRLLEPGGIFCMTSCSEAIGPEELERALGACVAREQRDLSIVTTGPQGLDHPWPAAMSEGQYATFTAAIVRA